MWRVYLSKTGGILKVPEITLSLETAQVIGNEQSSQNLNNDGSGNTNDRERNLSASMCCCWSVSNDHPSIHHEQRWLGATTGTGPDYA
jgi:hypothetical protein